MTNRGIHIAATTQFLGVDWSAFVVVFLVALIVTVAVVTCYGLGLRLLGAGQSASTRPTGATVGAFACFAVSAAAVLYGLYLVIPQFH
jgi:hypothetical protein